MKTRASPKTPAESESAVEQYHTIFPNDLNAINTVFGGMVLSGIDEVTGTVAKRHSNQICVTLEMDKVRFRAPARQGETLVFKAAINRAWNSSMEIGVRVIAENFVTKESRHITSTYLTYVAVDKEGKPVLVPKVLPQTEEERRRYREAGIRRARRLRNERHKKKDI